MKSTAVQRAYLIRYHQANRLLNHLKINLRRAYSAMRRAEPHRIEAGELLIEYSRLAGHSLIDPADELWATIREFLSDTANQRPLLIDISCSLCAVMVWQHAPRNRTAARFLDRVEALIVRCLENEKSPALPSRAVQTRYN
ncbi:MAG: hypothetical protein PVG66_05855 [Chromatiales bacterium]|jgi:hypothetical protein